ncbi:MAG: histidinol dehydrogenase [Ruthenibacterium sp.]
MIRILKQSEISMSEILNRGETQNSEKIERIVAEILKDVRENGDAAVQRYTKQFDGATLADCKVSDAEIDAAYAAADSEFIRTLNMAAENITAFHKRQIRQNFVINDQDGVVLGQKITPIARVGLYVPGGTASYPSSVLMNAIPAKLAGVEALVMVTPPDAAGKINPAILTAAKVAGVSAIYKMGGAQAIGALAYGTESIEKVDKIVGPGNVFVATAKRRVYGLVDIDMIAGPSEILVLADATANPAYVAADMLSQAEHDKLATAVLVCDSAALATAVSAELERQIPLLPRAEIARASIENQGKIIVANDLKQGVDIANALAPEHMEVCVDDPFSLLSAIRNAGSIFLGKNVPEALGDYFAGPNHTLPTGGTARFASPLSVDDFVKKSSFIYYTKEALAAVQTRVVDFAQREGLDAHANSVAIRFAQPEKDGTQ